ncbi:LOW QUALITY PROTEIN: hypothetical protein PanWU01x14_038840 [Parasponia andersonii]|uniref:Uncharacterized protein n=1 Tax=Parasponia andersonii TaxID=3476 RepID=A0A2P5DRL0_PARAD|nr:LOW QUALITY PROTEIN: hypothetical protein PanWU01x14_038840 [Parasponia andersonii]
MYGLDKNVIRRVSAKSRFVAKLLEAAEGERELCVEVERGTGEAALGDRLSGEGELETELGLAAAAFSDELRHGVAGNASVEAAVEDWTPERAFVSDEGAAKEVLWARYRHCCLE